MLKPEALPGHSGAVIAALSGSGISLRLQSSRRDDVMDRNTRLAVAAVVWAVSLACSPARPPEDTGNACTPGATVACTCTSGSHGLATCNAGGTLYGACECSAASSCDAGPEATCTCSDGGSGVAACLSDGGVGGCVCEGSGMTCTPGATTACSCGNGSTGEETCNAGGTGYGQCACSTTCTPGATMVCACGDGGQGEETCNSGGTGYGQCACATTCTPNSVTACTCGDGGPGEETCNGSGSGYGACVCDAPPACTASMLTANGSVTSAVGSINYTSTTVTATFQHFLGTGSGCLGTATLGFALETGSCALALQFGAVADGSGGLTSATLIVDSGCSTLMGLAVGTYSSTAGYGLTSLQLAPAIPNATSPTVCLSDATLQFGADGITLIDSTGSNVTVNLGALTVTGALFSTGAASATCYSTASCAPNYTESSQQWCTPMAGCATGTHNGGNGTCVADGTCSTGYHSDGTGNCVPLGQCATGYHDDGTGNCVPAGQCATGYHNGGTGTCVTNGTCVAGYHNGGDGSCVPLGECVTGDHDGGNGNCLPDGLCATGYMITTTGTCITTCATGDHDGGNGTCVPNGTCSSGYQNGGDGTCVTIGTCSAGYHSDGTGNCVLIGQCATGYILGTGGVCVAETACMLTGMPTADAGANQTATTGLSVTLNGDLSTGDLEPIASYAWTFVSVPTGSAATLTGHGVTATFVPDIVGSYVVQLVVTDAAGCSSSASTTTVTASACAAGLAWGWPTAVAGTLPLGSADPSAVYDSVNNRMVLFGGQSNGTAGSTTPNNNATWVLTLASGTTPTWTQLSPTGTLPAPRYFHSAVYIASLQEMIVFGGEGDTGTQLNDVWALSLPTTGTPAWTELTPAGTAPPVRSAHTAIYDSKNSRMIVFAGFNGTAALQDTWSLSFSGTPTWSVLAPTGTLPGIRAGQTAVYDKAAQTMVMFGGTNVEAAPTLYNDVWTLSLPATGTPAWTELAPTGTAPTAVANASAVYDNDTAQMFVFGGFDVGDVTGLSTVDPGGLWSLSLPATGTPAWSALTPTGTAPSPRDSQVAVYASSLKGMVVFGGEAAITATTFDNDSYLLSNVTCQ